MNMKEYMKPEISIVQFSQEDVIKTSNIKGQAGNGDGFG